MLYLSGYEIMILYCELFGCLDYLFGFLIADGLVNFLRGDSI